MLGWMRRDSLFEEALMARPIRLVTVLAVLFLVAGCTSDDGAVDEPAGTAAATTTEVATTTAAPTTTTAGSTTSVVDTADLIHGAWHWPEQDVYENYGDDGQFGVFLNSDVSGDPYDWGTYTFDDETLTFHNADGSVCPGATAVWTVRFSDDGTESHQTFVEDSCASVRGQDRVLIRQTP
jgi:hypothetical protein